MSSARMLLLSGVSWIIVSIVSAIVFRSLAFLKHEKCAAHTFLLLVFVENCNSRTVR